MKLATFIIPILIILPLCKSQESGTLNQYCITKEDCGHYGYVCGRNKSCQCNKMYIANQSKDKCVGGVGQSCKYDEHCIEGAFCEHQFECKCKEEFFAIDDGLICSDSKKVDFYPSLYFMTLAIFLLKYFTFFNE